LSVFTQNTSFLGWWLMVYRSRLTACVFMAGTRFAFIECPKSVAFGINAMLQAWTRLESPVATSAIVIDHSSS
jgi:hypothetical protein